MHPETLPTPRSELRNYPIRTIVAGSRGFDDYILFADCMEKFVADYTDKFIFISGMAPSGADAMIVQWCQEKGYPWSEFPADWKDISSPNAVIKYRNGKPYNVLAGFNRNAEMADIATDLITFYDGVSPGTRDMIELGRDKKLHVLTIYVDINDDMKRKQQWERTGKQQRESFSNT